MGGRFGPLGAAADAGRPVRRDRLEMLAGGVVMLPVALFTVHDFAPSTRSILGWIYLVTFGSMVGYTAYVWLLANAPLGSLDLCVRQPGRGDQGSA